MKKWNKSEQRVSNNRVMKENDSTTSNRHSSYYLLKILLKNKNTYHIHINITQLVTDYN